MPEQGNVTRRRFLAAAGAAAGAWTLGLGPGQLIERALATSPGRGSISDIKHLVILMQENRSFDHYFGTMRGVRGFEDRTSYRSFPGGPATDASTVFQQTTVDGSNTLLSVGGEPWLNPFELVSKPPSVAGQTTNDITHDWGPQHLSWGNGAMDQFVVQHLLNDGTAKWQLGEDGPGSSDTPIGILTMGYYRQRDSLAFYRALAEAFTICDGYHCSVMGPTDPNRLMWMSGSLGANSRDSGGQVITTYVTNRPELYGTLDWPTMPEVLSANGVSWKVYQDPTSQALFNVLTYFKNYWHPTTTDDARNAALGLAPVYPAEFAADVAAGTLPSVSWIMTPAPCCEHPAVPPEYGEYVVSQILQILLSNPDVWSQTAFLVVYDENGGWFDHVSPPTPGPLVTTTNGLSAPSAPEYDGEYLPPSPSNAAGGPPSDWGGVLGPVGLGFRTPAIVISPFSAGGWVCPDSFDHISTLKLIERLFLPSGTILGSDGLHVSPWRYNRVGDMTTALPCVSSPRVSVPPLPPTSMLYPDIAEQALLDALAGMEDDAQAYPVPSRNVPVPRQDEPGPSRHTTS